MPILGFLQQILFDKHYRKFCLISPYLTIRCCFPSPQSLEHFDHPFMTHSFWLGLTIETSFLDTVNLIEALYVELIWLEEAIITKGPSKGPLAIRTSSLGCSKFGSWLENASYRFLSKNDSLLERINLNRVPLVTTLDLSVFETSIPLNTM